MIRRRGRVLWPISAVESIDGTNNLGTKPPRLCSSSLLSTHIRNFRCRKDIWLDYVPGHCILLKSICQIDQNLLVPWGTHHTDTEGYVPRCRIGVVAVDIGPSARRTKIGGTVANPCQGPDGISMFRHRDNERAKIRTDGRLDADLIVHRCRRENGAVGFCAQRGQRKAEG